MDVIFKIRTDEYDWSSLLGEEMLEEVKKLLKALIRKLFEGLYLNGF
jgi:hypothetical protein